MTLRLYNTLTNAPEEFAPANPDRPVTFYTCGPTVYDYAHIGNFRAFLFADVLRRVIELHGFDVTHVMNITDVGHMTQDDAADGGGQDKMEVAAARLKEAKKTGTLPDGVDVDPDDPRAIADFYAEAFMTDAQCLGIKVACEAVGRPELMPRPSDWIEKMIELVVTLIDKGHAYVASDGVVYFDVQSWPAYGALSGNTIDQLRSGEGGRVDMATQAIKKHPADFMLFKPDPNHLVRWPSPWGEGYPGWHLECSVMASEILGDVIDVHSGGEDNIFPHHECELAQSCCASGQEQFARFWVHCRHLMGEGGEKMSKSSGTMYTIRDLLDRGASPAAIRLELIRTHYRTNAIFTMQGIKDAQRQVTRWKNVRAWMQRNASVSLQPPGPMATALMKFREATGSDLNLGGGIGALNEAIAAIDTTSPPTPDGDGAYTWEDELGALHAIDSVLGVLDLADTPPRQDDDESVVIEALIQARTDARACRDFSKADRVRDELLAMGIEIKDDPAGTTWTRVVQ